MGPPQSGVFSSRKLIPFWIPWIVTFLFKVILFVTKFPKHSTKQLHPQICDRTRALISVEAALHPKEQFTQGLIGKGWCRLHVG